MQAFLRFRQIGSGDTRRLLGWHSPDHNVAALVAPYFAERYRRFPWSIFTPQASVHWSGETLADAAGMPAPALPQTDTDEAAEALWRTYYGAVFNPARLNEKKLRRDLPVKFWGSLPEAREIVAAATVPCTNTRRRCAPPSSRRAGLLPSW